MNTLGIGPREVLALVRHSRSAAIPRGPILVIGVLAGELASELRAGGDATRVWTDGDPAAAAALVCVVGGNATAADEEALRAAARALVPRIAVQTGPASVPIPYVLATDVVQCRPGQGFPVAEIARTLAAALGAEGAVLAAALPVLRDAVQARRVADGTLAAAATALGRGGPRLPLLALAQVRMLGDLGAATGRTAAATPQATAEAVIPPLAAALATGLAARTLVRRLPVRNRLLDGVVAATATYALATAFQRVGGR